MFFYIIICRRGVFSRARAHIAIARESTRVCVCARRLCAHDRARPYGDFYVVQRSKRFITSDFQRNPNSLSYGAPVDRPCFKLLIINQYELLPLWQQVWTVRVEMLQCTFSDFSHLSSILPKVSHFEAMASWRGPMAIFLWNPLHTN